MSFTQSGEPFVQELMAECVVRIAVKVVKPVS